jgi:hypothetical protein
MTSLVRAALVTAFAAFSFAACASDPPTCSATDMSYTICAEEQVWECPVATAEQQAKKKAITDACGNDTQCILNAKYEMYPMTLKAKCGEGGQVCVQSMGPGAQSASCQMK